MDAQQFLRVADACLAAVATWLEALDPDEVDFSTADGLVTLEFPDGAKFILNRQAASQQMWLAAGAQAWHYDWDAAGNEWINDRDGHRLFVRIAEVVAGKLGHPVDPIGAA